MTDDVPDIPYLKGLSNATVQIAITQSMSIHFTAVILSETGILTSATALVHNAGSCFVVLPAVLLYDRKYRKGFLSKGKEIGNAPL